MSKVVVFNHLSLDGVMQAPGRTDEDLRSGFEHGGWATSRMDPVMAGVVAEGMSGEGGLLLGRRTYEDFADFWPKQREHPFTAVMGKIEKSVASTTLKEPLSWSNSMLLKGDAADAVAKLKEQLDRISWCSAAASCFSR